MHQLPKYDPPSFNTAVEGSLNDRVKSFFMFWNNLQQYLYNYLNNLKIVLQSDGNSPYAALPATATISPTRHVQSVSGNTTITNISVPQDFVYVTLLAPNGFSLSTGGNIAANFTVSAGRAVTLYKNLLDGQWYISD